MNDDPTTPTMNARSPSIAATIIQIAAAPLLLAVWALADAGLPWTVYYVRVVLRNGASLNQEYLREDWHTWVRVGLLLVIVAFWLIPWARIMRNWFIRWRATSTTKCDVVEDLELVILTIHIVTLAMTVTMIPWLSGVGMPWRVRSALPAAEELADAMFADWPKELMTDRAGWRLGRTEKMAEHRFFILHGHSTSPYRMPKGFSFTEGLGLSLERDDAGDAIAMDLSFDMHERMNALVVMRTSDVRIDKEWLRAKRIRWCERIQLGPRVFLVQFVQ